MSRLFIFSIILIAFSVYTPVDAVTCYQCAESINGTLNGGSCVTPDEKTKKEDGCSVCISADLFNTNGVMIRDCLKNIKLAKNMSCCVNDKEDPSLLYCVCNDQDGCSGDANVACKKNDITHFKKHVSKRSIMIKNPDFFDKFNHPNCSTTTNEPSIGTIPSTTTRKSSGSIAVMSLMTHFIAAFLLIC